MQIAPIYNFGRYYGISNTGQPNVRMENQNNNSSNSSLNNDIYMALSKASFNDARIYGELKTMNLI